MPRRTTARRAQSRTAGFAAVVAVASALAFPPGARALGTADYVGRIGLVTTDFCPHGTLPADGSLLQIAQYSTLYSLVGNGYGGDGKTTFALPDLRGKEPVPDSRYCIVFDGIYPSAN